MALISIVVFVESRRAAWFLPMDEQAIKSLHDDELVAQYLLTGATVCFEELWRRYARQVYRCSQGIVGDPAGAEDVTSETFLKAWRALDTYEPGQFRAWLLRITRTTSINYLQRASQRHERATGADYERMTNEKPGESASPEDLALAKQIQGFIEHLPPKQRIAIKLFYIDGCSYEQIATETGTSISAVKSALQNGVRMLRILCDVPTEGGAK
ncbi:MAG: sigma-70 family RNA polymerase sigma factor [Acidobacteriota bacterium]